MSREFFAIGMMEYGGLGLLIVAGLFVGALELANALFNPAAKRSRAVQRRSRTQKTLPRSNSRPEGPQNFQ